MKVRRSTQTAINDLRRALYCFATGDDESSEDIANAVRVLVADPEYVSMVSGEYGALRLNGAGVEEVELDNPRAVLRGSPDLLDALFKVAGRLDEGEQRRAA